MRKMWAISGGFVLALGVALAQDSEPPPPQPVKTERAKKAEEAAEKFVTAFAQGDAKAMSALTAVPFAFDRKKTIESKADLDAMFTQIQQEKAKRNKGMEVFSAAVYADRADIQEQCIPNDYVLVKVEVGNGKRSDTISLCVRPTAEAYLVVGLSD